MAKKETAFWAQHVPLPEDIFWIILSLVIYRACVGRPTWMGPSLRVEHRKFALTIGKSSQA